MSHHQELLGIVLEIFNHMLKPLRKLSYEKVNVQWKKKKQFLVSTTLFEIKRQVRLNLILCVFSSLFVGGSLIDI